MRPRLKHIEEEMRAKSEARRAWQKKTLGERIDYAKLIRKLMKAQQDTMRRRMSCR